MRIPKDLVLIWPSLHSAIPAKYVRETSLDGLFPKAWGLSIDPDTTGGAATHTHTSPAHNHTIASHTHTYTLAGTTTNLGAGNGFPETPMDTHTHNGTSEQPSGGTTSADAVTYGSSSNNPPYTEVIFVRAEEGALLVDGLGVLWTGWDGDVTIPNNYQLFDGTNASLDLRNRYLRGASTGGNAGGTGGSYTNVHDISHTHTPSSHTHPAGNNNYGQFDQVGEGFDFASYGGHSHQVQLNASTQAINAYSGSLTTLETVEPLYIKVCALLKKTGAIKEKGIIGLWLGDIDDIPKGWVLCDGENGTLDLRDRFLKIANNTGEIGDVGGANSHAHAAQSHTHSGSGSHTHTGTTLTDHSAGNTHHAGAASPIHRVANNYIHPVTNVSSASVGYNASTTTADSSNNEPEYRTVAYIQFQKDIYGGAALQAFL